MRKLLFLTVLLIGIAFALIAQVVTDTGGGDRDWYYAQYYHTVAAGASPDTVSFSNSFFNATVWTDSDSMWIKIGTWRNSYTAVDSFVYIPANVFFKVPSIEGVRYIVINKGVAGENDAGTLFIAGDKYVTE